MLDTDLQGLLQKTRGISSYIPLFEAIINSIHSIADANQNDGVVTITPIRSGQQNLLDKNIIPEIEGFIIEDNGEGFNKDNFSSFSKLYSRKKIQIGGKGFGRITYLKVFKKVNVTSIFESETGEKISRAFSFSPKDDGVSEPDDSVINVDNELKTIVTLSSLITNKKFDKQISVIARKIVEHFLLLFHDQDKLFPKITISCPIEGDIVLNDFLSKSDDINFDYRETFSVGIGDDAVDLKLVVFKVYFPSKRISEICLCADKRVVEGVRISKFIPEFDKPFIDTRGENETDNQYVFRAYVQGQYLNENVDELRDKFTFSQEEDLFNQVSQDQIESTVAYRIGEKYTIFLNERMLAKHKRINDFIDNEEPWYKPFREDLDFSHLPEGISDKELSIELYKIKFEKQVETKSNAKKILDSNDDNADDHADTISDLVSSIGKMQQSDLVQYVAHRKLILDLFERSLETDENNKYVSEDDIHKIIFPTKKDSEEVEYERHNLWILDEKHSFSQYLTSDKEINGPRSDRGDIVIFDNKISVREGDRETNPITIFEFKKPGIDSFTNPSAKEDPVTQIIRYVKQYKAGKFKTPTGRQIEVDQNTPFYAYVVCTFTTKVKDWLDEKDMTEMPDKQGYYMWHDKLKISFQVISWDKMLQDSKIRNKIFFKKLNID